MTNHEILRDLGLPLHCVQTIDICRLDTCRPIPDADRFLTSERLKVEAAVGGGFPYENYNWTTTPTILKRHRVD